MATLKVEAKHGEAMVYMTDGNQYRVEGEQAFALETLLTQAQITLTPP
jgi:hypothetical protein